MGVREWINRPGRRLALGACLAGMAVRVIVDVVGEQLNAHNELVELHADTRTRVFQLETLKEAGDVVGDRTEAAPAAAAGEPTGINTGEAQ